MQSKGNGQNITPYVLPSSSPFLAVFYILLLSLSLGVVSQLSLYGQLIKCYLLRGFVSDSLCELTQKKE